MRVCILAQASPATWVEHYIAAFRACCETIVVGPTPSPDQLRAWDRDQVMELPPPHDITMDFATDSRSLHEVLPEGWRPDLVVGIAGVGGDPLYRGVAALTCPTVFLSIDTWQCLLDYREARAYDIVFTAQREFVPHLQATGSAHVAWLPLAAAPEKHYPAQAAPICDIAFAGSASLPVHTPRRELLTSLSQSFSLVAKERVYGDALCRFFGQGRLAFNHSAVQELNMRIFEALAMGCALLTNAEANFNGLSDLFEDGKHLIIYRDHADLMAKVQEYLADDAKRQALAEAGRAEVLARHCYTHRVQTILDTLKKHNLPTVAGRHEWAYQGDDIAAYLPTVPGVVADYGLGLAIPRTQQGARGIRRLMGIAEGPPASREMRNRYEEILPLAAMPFGEMDTVVVADARRLSIPLDELFRRAHALLGPGGSLLLYLAPACLKEKDLKPSPESLGPWLQAQDFHLRLHRIPPSGGVMLLARKRSRRLASIVAEVFGRLQVPELDIGELLSRIPPTW